MSNFGQGEGSQIPDAWWASLARRLLHPVQMEIIEALRRSDEALSMVDLAERTERAALTLAHHLRRLYKVGAVTYAEAPTLRNATNVSYRLTPRWSDDERR